MSDAVATDVAYAERVIAPASSAEAVEEPAPLPPKLNAKPLPKKAESLESSAGKRPPAGLSDDIEPRRRPTWKPMREDEDE
jgi:hypothetical protein